jgi:hypothetical protein
MSRHLHDEFFDAGVRTIDESALGITITDNGFSRNQCESVQIGLSHWKGPVTISDINLRELVAKVEELQTRVDALQELTKEQSELITAMWYYPGMPGANEAKEQFKENNPKISLSQ